MMKKFKQYIIENEYNPNSEYTDEIMDAIKALDFESAKKWILKAKEDLSQYEEEGGLKDFQKIINDTITFYMSELKAYRKKYSSKFDEGFVKFLIDQGIDISGTLEGIVHTKDLEWIKVFEIYLGKKVDHDIINYEVGDIFGVQDIFENRPELAEFLVIDRGWKPKISFPLKMSDKLQEHFMNEDPAKYFKLISNLNDKLKKKYSHLVMGDKFGVFDEEV